MVKYNNMMEHDWLIDNIYDIKIENKFAILKMKKENVMENGMVEE